MKVFLMVSKVFHLVLICYMLKVYCETDKSSPINHSIKFLPPFVFISNLVMNHMHGLLKMLFHFVVLGCWAVHNPLQSPMLAHCSVQE